MTAALDVQTLTLKLERLEEGIANIGVYLLADAFPPEDLEDVTGLAKLLRERVDELEVVERATREHKRNNRDPSELDARLYRSLPS